MGVIRTRYITETFLAVSQPVYLQHFQKPISQLVIKRNKINLLVHKPIYFSDLSMAKSLKYSEILTQLLQRAASVQTRL